VAGGTPLATAFVRLRSDDSGFQADVEGKIGQPLQRVSERGKAAFSALAGIIGQSGAFAPLSGAIDAVSQGLDYIQQNGRRTGTVLIGAGAAAAAAGALLVASSRKDVEAHVQLKQAIENSGHAFEPYAKRVEEAITHQERFGHTADDTQQALRRLTEATGDPTKAIERMGLVADIAAAKHITLVEAAGLVAKILNGTGGKALAAYGIHIDKTKDKTQEANRALDELAKKLHGQASASADTFSGRLEGLKVHLEDVFNAMGAKVGPALTILGTALGAVGSAIEIFGAAKAALATRAATRLAAAQTEAAAAADRLGAAEVAAAAGTTEAAVAASGATAANERLAGSSAAAGTGVGRMGALLRDSLIAAVAFAGYQGWDHLLDKLTNRGVPTLNQMTLSLQRLANVGITDGGGALKGLGDELDTLAKNSAFDTITRKLATLGGGPSGEVMFRSATKDVKQLDAALAAMVGGGHAQQAATAMTLLRSQLSPGQYAQLLRLLPSYRDALDGVKVATGGVAAATHAAALAAGYLGRVIDVLSGRLNIDKAIISTADASRALSKSIRENGKDFSDLTVKGGANKTALIAVAEGYAQIRDAQIKSLAPTHGLTAATNAANVAYAKNVAGLRGVLRAAGLTGAQIDALVKSVVAANATPPPKIPVTAPNLNTTNKGMQALHDLILRNTGQRVSVPTSAPGASGAGGQLSFIQRLIRDVNGKHVVIHFDQLFSSSGNRYTSGGSSTLGGILSGSNHRAAGGPVKRGHSYIVGEERPELFTPDSDGTIIPDVPTSGAGGSADPAGLAQALAAVLQDMTWQLRIDPQGLATVVAAGNRGLARRG
jgi:uncharacterized protein YukE